MTRYLRLLLRKEGHNFHTSAEQEIVKTIKEVGPDLLTTVHRNVAGCTQLLCPYLLPKPYPIISLFSLDLVMLSLCFILGTLFNLSVCLLRLVFLPPFSVIQWGPFGTKKNQNHRSDILSLSNTPRKLDL